MVARAFRRDARSVYRMTFVSPQRQTRALAEAFRQTTFSFRYLGEAEAAAVKAMRLLVVTPQAGDTVATLARTLPYGRFNEPFFRMLNDLGPGDRLPRGGPVKVVAA